MKKIASLSYIPALDSLRAWAVLMVIFEHYFQNLLPSYCHFISFGGLGVGIFFTLSGFLITTILLEEKKVKTSFIYKLKKFYFRRFLRLFPIYYVTILVAFFVFPVLNIKENIWYYLTYTTNFRIFQTGNWEKVGHFWSLAVEEQFYIVWPFIVILLDYKQLKIVIICCILIGILFKIYFGVIENTNEKFYWILTPFNFDLLGFGALLAWLRVYKPMFWSRILELPIRFWLLFVAFLGVLIVSYLFDNHSIINWLLFYHFTAFFALAWIVIAFSRVKWPLLLHNKVFNYLGRMSYGMYVYHLPIMGLWGFNSKWFQAKGLDYQFVYWFDNPFIVACCCLLTTFVVSLFSYWLVEWPINQLKKRYS